MRRFLKAAAVGLAAVLVLSVAGYAWMKLAPRRVPEGQPPLETLHAGSLAAFRDAFNAGEGKVRVLALLSPT